MQAFHRRFPIRSTRQAIVPRCLEPPMARQFRHQHQVIPAPHKVGQAGVAQPSVQKVIDLAFALEVGIEELLVLEVEVPSRAGRGSGCSRRVLAWGKSFGPLECRIPTAGKSFER